MIQPQRPASNTVRPFPEIKHFPGHYMQETTNILNLPTGSLIENKNCEYGIHDKFVYPKSRRGSTVISDTTNGEIGTGIARFNDLQYLFWIDAVTGELKYTIESSGVATGTGHIFSTTVLTDMLFYNCPAVPTLYITNMIDGLHKLHLSGMTFVVEAVASSPIMSRISFSNISGRMFGVGADHTVYYSEIQQFTAVDTSNLETWNTTTNFAIVSPDQGDGFTAIIDDGNTMYFIKDTGIWVLPNADGATTDWIIPKLKIDIGSSAPLTVLNVRYLNQNGICFLANDNTIRFFTGNVLRNAGVLPTYQEGQSMVLSHEYQYILDTIDRGQFGKCAAAFYDQVYTLSYAAESATSINAMVCIDFEKGKQFWFNYENYMCTSFQRTKDKFFGFDNRGFIVSLLVNNKIYDESPSRIAFYSDDRIDPTKPDINQIAIRWSVYTSWIKVSDYLNRLISGYINYATGGNKPLLMKINSFIKGETIPPYNSGVISSLKVQASGGVSYWDASFFDESKFSEVGTQQTNAGNFNTGEGNYFNFGFYSDNIYQSVTIYSLQLNFKQLRNTPNVSN